MPKMEKTRPTAMRWSDERPWGDDDAVVEGDGNEDGTDEEDGKGASRDLEGGTDVAVHGGGLRHREGGHLGIDGPKHDGGGPGGEHSDHLLHLLHVRQGGEPPLALFSRRRRDGSSGKARRLFLHAQATTAANCVNGLPTSFLNRYLLVLDRNKAKPAMMATAQMPYPHRRPKWSWM
ncbi:hypothetical protein C4D60_Mb11t03970 [Musa balbisiana]|uniref:Uncharacterized protein n=1 Tax=Musa balbisiana TaxID=52838 RepID=A0A4S8J1M7_MUSBA|nr:hypothetical protein C4D60_Mb11t03970 [Musa balbisiana]